MTTRDLQKFIDERIVLANQEAAGGYDADLRQQHPTERTSLMAWTFEFEDGGGYGSMTDAFNIYENGKLRFVIDQGDFGQSRAGPNNIKIPEAEALAIKIVDALNKT